MYLSDTMNSTCMKDFCLNAREVYNLVAYQNILFSNFNCPVLFFEYFAVLQPLVNKATSKFQLFFLFLSSDFLANFEKKMNCQHEFSRVRYYSNGHVVFCMTNTKIS